MRAVLTKNIEFPVSKTQVFVLQANTEVVIDQINGMAGIEVDEGELYWFEISPNEYSLLN